MRVRPILELRERHPEANGFLDALDLKFGKSDVLSAYSEFASQVTHGSRAIAAAAGLMKHQRAMHDAEATE